MPARAVVKLDADARQFNRKMKGAAGVMEKQSARMRAAFSKVGQMAKRTALVVAAVGGAAVKMAADFDRGIAEIGTLMGGLTNGAMQAMKQQLMDVAEQTGQAMDKLTKARYDIVSAGFFDAAESMKVLDVAARTAVATVSDVATSADLLTTALNAYGMSADNAEQVSDVLFVTVQQGKTTMDQLAGVMGRAIPIAAELRVPLETLSGAIATLTARGQSTDEAVTALRQTMVQLLKPSEDAVEVIQSLGYESGRAIVEALGFGGALKHMRERAKELNIDLADVFPNVRAMQGAFPLAGDAAAEFADKTEIARNAAGNMNDAFQQMEERVSTQMAKAWQQVRNEMIRLGDAIMPAVSDALKGITTSLQNNQPAIQNFVEKVGQIVQWAVDHGDIIGKILVATTITRIAAPMLTIASAATKIVSALGASGLLGIATSAVSISSAGLIAAIVGGVMFVKNIATELGRFNDEADRLSQAAEHFKEMAHSGEQIQTLDEEIQALTEDVKGLVKDPNVNFATLGEQVNNALDDRSIDSWKALKDKLAELNKTAGYTQEQYAALEIAYQTVVTRLQGVSKHFDDSTESTKDAGDAAAKTSQQIKQLTKDLAGQATALNTFRNIGTNTGVTPTGVSTEDVFGITVEDARAAAEYLGDMPRSASDLNRNLNHTETNTNTIKNTWQDLHSTSVAINQSVNTFTNMLNGVADRQQRVADLQQRARDITSQLYGNQKLTADETARLHNELRSVNGQLDKAKMSTIDWVKIIGQAVQGVGSVVSALSSFTGGDKGSKTGELISTIGSIVSTVATIASLFALQEGGQVTNIGGRGTYTPYSEAPHFAGGTKDFIVPPGYPNDSFPIMVQSGERITVTPTDRVVSRPKPVTMTSGASSNRTGQPIIIDMKITAMDAKSVEQSLRYGEGRRALVRILNDIDRKA